MYNNVQEYIALMTMQAIAEKADQMRVPNGHYEIEYSVCPLDVNVEHQVEPVLAKYLVKKLPMHEDKLKQN